MTMMTTSESIADLATALAKAQGAFPSITKGKTAKIEGKANYSYDYADLADILDATRKALAENGLAVIQPIVRGEEHPWLVTRLLHASGQWIESAYPLAVYERPQETGSAITYARRYALTALLGIAAEDDDDGATAQGAERKTSSGNARPKCPKCEKGTVAVIEGKDEFGGGWLCFGKKGGCGAKWYDETRPDPKPAAPVDDDPFSEPAPAADTASAFLCPHCKSDKVTPDGPKYMRCEACQRGYKKPGA